MHREPDVGFDLGSPGSRPGPKAGAKPLRHPGVPINQLLTKVKKYLDNNTLILGDFNLALSTLDRFLRTTFPKKEEL